MKERAKILAEYDTHSAIKILKKQVSNAVLPMQERKCRVLNA